MGFEWELEWHTDDTHIHPGLHTQIFVTERSGEDRERKRKLSNHEPPRTRMQDQMAFQIPTAQRAAATLPPTSWTSLAQDSLQQKTSTCLMERVIRETKRK